MTNTTTYTTENPVGSILTASLFDIHPGEDMYMLISSVPDRVVEDYQLILGENLIITRGLAAQTTTASTTLLVDNLDPSDKTPVVGSVVTGPNIKAGVVTVLGAITAAGTGYTNGAAQILATTGAGGNNLTLNVTVVNGSLTTAAISGANNDGTGYTSGDIVTVVGGNNDAKVSITTATPKPASVTAFDPTNNQVTFNSAQTVADNTKVTFTVPNVIPDNDTVPVSQQGYFVYNTMSLGVDTMWDSYQRQFYNGEYSGSEFVVVTQSLLNNPFASSTPSDTPYHLNVTMDAGDFGPTSKVNNNTSLNPDEEYSVHMLFIPVDDSSNYGFETATNALTTPLSPNYFGSTFNTGAFFINKWVANPQGGTGANVDNFVITGMILPNSVEKIGVNISGTILPYNEQVSDELIPMPNFQNLPFDFNLICLRAKNMRVSSRV